MAIIPLYLRRPKAILEMPEAIARGMSATAFLRKLKAQGLGYRRQTFFSDWRSVSGVEKREGALKFVRRDRRPSPALLADVEWEMSKEYMYKVRARYRTSPEEPLQERFVNIPSDKPLTPLQAQEAVFERWSGWERYEGEILESATVETGFHRIEELEPEIE